MGDCIHRFFPNVKVITVLLPFWREVLGAINEHTNSVPHGESTVKIVYPNEVGGEVDLEAMTELDGLFVGRVKAEYIKEFYEDEENHPEQQLPVLKFRSKRQFIENEGAQLDSKALEDLGIDLGDEADDRECSYRRLNLDCADDEHEDSDDDEYSDDE